MCNRLVVRLGLAFDRRGVTALEYGLIAALIAATIAGAVGKFGTNMSTLFDRIAGSL